MASYQAHTCDVFFFLGVCDVFNFDGERNIVGLEPHVCDRVGAFWMLKEVGNEGPGFNFVG